MPEAAPVNIRPYRYYEQKVELRNKLRKCWNSL